MGGIRGACREGDDAVEEIRGVRERIRRDQALERTEYEREVRKFGNGFDKRKMRGPR